MAVSCGGALVVWDLIRCDVKDRFLNPYGSSAANLYSVHDMPHVFLALFIPNDLFPMFMSQIYKKK